MNAPNDNTAPSRSGRQGPITSWGHRHLRVIAAVRFAVGIFLTGLGAVMVSRGAYVLAALPLAGAAVHFSWGSWQLILARSVSR
jgi:hypothetical protein